jgi:hypothetical protein
MCKEKVTGPAKDNCERLGAKRCLQCGVWGMSYILVAVLTMMIGTTLRAWWSR